MFDKLEKLQSRYQELEELLASYETFPDREQYNKYAKELSGLREQVSLFKDYKNIGREIDGLKQVLEEKHDREFLELVRRELAELKDEQSRLEQRLKSLLAREKTEADKDIIVEIRPGTGGLEAALFAADLYRMYSKYAANRGWKVEPMSFNPTELGGLKEVAFSIKGKSAHKRMKFESGVHRVQRVPSTEASGRIHTSTATVVVLIEPEEKDLVIEPKDLRIDTYRSSGPGGQHMQKTDSAVRITHLSTGIVVACQDERSQIKNKNKAMRILRAKLLDSKHQQEVKKLSEERKSQIGTGDRSEKIRTYNFPDRRVTDHRINFTSHQLESILQGELDEIQDALLKAEQEKKSEK